MVAWVSRRPLSVGRRGSVTIDSGAFEAQIGKMFGAPDESRLCGSWRLAEGVREGLAHQPGWAGLPPKGIYYRKKSPDRCRPGHIFTYSSSRFQLHCPIESRAECGGLSDDCRAANHRTWEAWDRNFAQNAFHLSGG